MSSDKTTQTAWRRLLPRAVLYHEAVADRLGINPTDLKCLELLAGEEAMSPSRLAELAGLTTGAITGVIDRLERAGIVRREPDPTDRRRIAIHIRPERTVELSRLYAPFLAGAADLETSADAPSRRPTSVGVDAVTRLLENETGRLRAAAHGGMVGDTFVAPTGAATQGRLVFIAAAPRLAMHKVALGQQARLVSRRAPRDCDCSARPPATSWSGRASRAPSRMPARRSARSPSDIRSGRSTSGRDRPTSASNRVCPGSSRSKAA